MVRGAATIERMAVHLRQFLIGPEPGLVRADWLSRALPSGLYLSHCPTLPIEETAHGTVLGDAIDTDASGGPDSWAGRWILLGDERLRLDTCGVLACHYRVVDSRRWISSSPEILRTIEPELPMHEDRLERGRQLMDWYPPPHSAIEGIGRVLPSQTMSLADGSMLPVTLPAGDLSADHEAVLRRSQERLVTAIRNTSALAAKAGGRIWIGLTAGIDSRTLLAAAVVGEVEVMTYTFIRDKTPKGDRELPRVLAAAAGFEHLEIPLDVIDADRADEFDRHTAASFPGGARLQYAAGGWDRVEASAIALEGGVFEVARGNYYYRLPREMGSSAIETTEIILKRFPSQRPAGVRAWVDWVRGPGQQQDLDWRDRFYLEQRVGGALSSGVQGFDITGQRMVYLANCPVLLGDLLGAPEEPRWESLYEHELVERMAPALSVYPYNPGSTKGESARKAFASRTRKKPGVVSRLRRRRHG